MRWRWDVRFQFITVAIHRPDKGGRKHLWNIGQLLRDYMAQYPIELSSSEKYGLFYVIFTSFPHTSASSPFLSVRSIFLTTSFLCLLLHSVSFFLQVSSILPLCINSFLRQLFTHPFVWLNSYFSTVFFTMLTQRSINVSLNIPRKDNVEKASVTVTGLWEKSRRKRHRINN
jgi:hypothetical protein